MSSSVPCAPSKSTALPLATSCESTSLASPTYGRIRSPSLSAQSISGSSSHFSPPSALICAFASFSRSSLGPERAFLEHVAHADPAPRYLVLVAGPDAAAGGADRLLLLAPRVDPLVVRQDHVRVLAHRQLGRVGEQAAAAEQIDLLQQRFRIDHDAVANDALLARVQDAARHQVQHGLHPAHHQRMPGVRAPLEPHHHVGPGGEEVDDLSLAFVAPLRADDHHVGHATSLSRRRAAAVRGRWGAALGQLRIVGRCFEEALDGRATGASEEEGDVLSVGDELPPPAEHRRIAGDYTHFFRGIEQQPFLGSGLALPGAHQPGNVGPECRDLWFRRGASVRPGRPLRRRLLVLPASRAGEQPDHRQRPRRSHRVTWYTLRTLGSRRRRSSTSAGAAVSTFTSASASPLLRSRESANCAMFTWASPRVRPTLPMTPGLSSLCMTRTAPSGKASSSNLSTRTTRGSRLPTMVPATSVDSSLPQRRRTETRLAKSGVSLVFTSVTERPRSRARAGAETSLTGSARKLPRTPFRTAAVSGAVGCCATSPA